MPFWARGEGNGQTHECAANNLVGIGGATNPLPVATCALIHSASCSDCCWWALSLRYEYQDDIVPHLPPGVEFRAMFAKVPLFNDFIASSNAKLPDGAVGFVGVGDLKFIDWSDAIVGIRRSCAFSVTRI